MEINYSQFLHMIPEVTLMAVLVIAFVADFCSAKSEERKWFNPLMVILMAAHLVINIFPVEPSQTFGGMYHTNAAIHWRYQDNSCLGNPDSSHSVT